MKKSLGIILLFILFLLVVMPTLTSAHSGRTDSNGGHNCSAKSKSKGLCSGYHYHNGGSSNKSTNVSSTSTKITKVKVISNEYPPAPHCIKLKDTYKSTDTYYNYYERNWDCNRYTIDGEVFTYLDLNLYVNNQYMNLNSQLISVKNSSYISVRDFSNSFNFSIELDKVGNVILKKDKIIIKITTHDKKILLNDKYTGVKAIKAEGYYYVPLRSAMALIDGKINSVENSKIYLSY